MSEGIKWSDPIKVGAIEAKNRVFMASLTRVRGDLQTGIGNDLVLQYYLQRAGFGIIFTEASTISQRGIGNLGVCSLFNEDQAAFWKRVVDELHARGSRIVAQLWHQGRAADPQLNGGLETYSSSPFPVKGTNYQTQKPYSTPKEMTEQEIQDTIQEYVRGAQLAKSAGFDGIELHAANGYLIDQFLKDGINKRTDKYGGSVENRCRFALEVLDAVIPVFGADRIGLKLSPTGRYLDQFDSNPIETYSHLIADLDKRKIAFIQVNESSPGDAATNPPGLPLGVDQIPNSAKVFRPLFSGTLITNGGFNLGEAPQGGLEKLRRGEADAMTFGKLAISNPDLADRLIHEHPLNLNLDWGKLYGQTPEGYVDYPTYAEQQTK